MHLEQDTPSDQPYHEEQQTDAYEETLGRANVDVLMLPSSLVAGKRSEFSAVVVIAVVNARCGHGSKWMVWKGCDAENSGLLMEMNDTSQ